MVVTVKKCNSDGRNSDNNNGSGNGGDSKHGGAVIII